MNSSSEQKLKKQLSQQKVNDRLKNPDTKLRLIALSELPDFALLVSIAEQRFNLQHRLPHESEHIHNYNIVCKSAVEEFIKLLYSSSYDTEPLDEEDEQED